MKDQIKGEETMTETQSKVKTQRKKPSKKKVEAAQFDQLQGKFLLVRVGTADEPAKKEEIDAIREQLIELFDKNDIDCLAFVTHHAVEMEIIGNHNNGEV